MHFLEPGWLFLLLGVAALVAVYVVLQRRRSHYVARFANVELLGSVAPRRPGWRRHLVFALLMIALTVLSIGVAKPSAAVRVPRDRATVMLAIDVSLSMKSTDVLPSRIQAAQDAAKEFAGLLPSRINLGLVEFARTGDVLVSPTTNRAQVRRGIDDLHLQEYTAIGEGIFASLGAIRSFSKATGAKGQKPAPARIVLLSDGSNTVGRSITSAEAAARAQHVPISTIAFGTPDGTVTVNGVTVPVPADRPELHSIADATGGSYFSATTESELRSIYHNIGAQIGYTTEHRDVSWRWLVAGVFVLFAAGAAGQLWSGRMI